MYTRLRLFIQVYGSIRYKYIFFYHSSSASCTWKLNRPSKPEDCSFTQPVTQTALPRCIAIDILKQIKSRQFFTSMCLALLDTPPWAPARLLYKDFDCEHYFHSHNRAIFIFQFQIQSAFDKEKLSTESLLKLQTYFGFSWILGCLAFGFIVILKPRGCQITKLYLCIFSLIICGFCCFLADFVQGVSH